MQHSQEEPEPRRDIDLPVLVNEKGWHTAEKRLSKWLSPEVVTRIHDVQPYVHTQSPLQHPLYVLHELDLADKHRITVSTAARGSGIGMLMGDGPGILIEWELLIPLPGGGENRVSTLVQGLMIWTWHISNHLKSGGILPILASDEALQSGDDPLPAAE